MNRKRVQQLRNMIAGIPQKKINLNSFYRKNGAPCGTIACIAGWAAIYPPFVEQGLHTVQTVSSRKIPKFCEHYGRFAAAEFFDVNHSTFYVRLKTEGGTDKQIALRRLDALLGKAVAEASNT